MATAVEKFIEQNRANYTRTNTTDNGTLMGLPYPYSIPSVDWFEELYYWDTYFTNIGLLVSGDELQAKNNVDDMLFIVDKYGFMPNASRTTFLTRSQPPFLALMVKEVYEFFGDKKWLAKAYKTLKREYTFWIENRSTPLGLCRYHGFAEEEHAKALADRLKERTGVSSDLPDIELARHLRLVCESGWDNNPRWGFKGFNFLHVDLNSMLFSLESCMMEFAEILQNGEEAVWKQRLDERCALMRKYLKTPDGYFTDFDFVNGGFSKFFSAASFYPLFVGLATKEEAEATVKNLSRIEEAYGVCPCEKNDIPGKYQWNYPNGWACHQYILYVSLKRYGYDEDAKRIAKKYISLVEKVFDETGELWEKYNVVEGNINVVTESKMPAMLGWSAGVYLALKAQTEAKT